MNYKYFKILKRLFIQKPAPYLIFYVTSRCNANCKFCFLSDNINNKPELSLEEIRRFTQSYGKLIQCTLTGGEPFLRADFDKIIELFYLNCNPLYFTIPTNGSQPERIEKTMDYCSKTFNNSFFRISLSIDNIREKHDAIRNCQGLFQNARETFFRLRKLNRKNISVDILTVLNKYNESDCFAISEYIRHNFKPDNHLFLFARGNPSDKTALDFNIQNYQNICNYELTKIYDYENRPFSFLFRNINKTVQDIILQTKILNKKIIDCKAGNKLIVVYSDGDILPCELLNTQLGNLKNFNYNINKILRTDTYNKTLKFIKDTGCSCTWECAIGASVIYNPSYWLKIIYHTISDIIKSKFRIS